MPLSNISPAELVMVLAIALIVLGPKRLPDAARSVGNGVRQFKAALSGGDADESASSAVERGDERPPSA